MFFTFVPRKPDGFIKVFHILMWLGLHRVGVALFYIGLQNRRGICRRGRPMCLPEEITTQWLGAHIGAPLQKFVSHGISRRGRPVCLPEEITTQ